MPPAVRVSSLVHSTGTPKNNFEKSRLTAKTLASERVHCLSALFVVAKDEWSPRFERTRCLPWCGSARCIQCASLCFKQSSFRRFPQNLPHQPPPFTAQQPGCRRFTQENVPPGVAHGKRFAPSAAIFSHSLVRQVPLSIVVRRKWHDTFPLFLSCPVLDRAILRASLQRHAGL